MITITLPWYICVALGILVLIGLYTEYRRDKARQELYQLQKQALDDNLKTIESLTEVMDKLLQKGTITISYKETDLS